MPLNFTLVDTNPNATTGGNGTLCSEVTDQDALGPFFVWGQTEMDSAISPFVVVAASEVEAMYAALHDGAEVRAGGEKATIPITVRDTSHIPSKPLNGTFDEEGFARALARKD